MSLCFNCEQHDDKGNAGLQAKARSKKEGRERACGDDKRASDDIGQLLFANYKTGRRAKKKAPDARSSLASDCRVRAQSVSTADRRRGDRRRPGSRNFWASERSRPVEEKWAGLDLGKTFNSVTHFTFIT